MAKKPAGPVSKSQPKLNKPRLRIQGVDFDVGPTPEKVKNW